MAAELPGSDEAFFFRKAELSYLQNRLDYPGVTVICGRPRSGKSWLLGKLLRQVQSDSKTLIGFTRCSAQDSDSLMRMVDDLYTRWREGATLLDQAKEIFNNTRGRWPQLISNVVGKIVDATVPFGDLSSLVSGALNGLLDLQPGTHVPRLKYEQAQQLIFALATITQAERVILVLDQWEQSKSLDYEIEHLRNFSRDSDDWPDTHFLISIRPHDSTEQLLKSYCVGLSGFAEIYHLPLFYIESDAKEKQRLIGFLSENVPACRTVQNADDYLSKLEGYVGVLENWTRRVNRARMRDLADLTKKAEDAQKGRYPEIAEIVPQLEDATRELCVRLALLPDFTEQSWPVLRPVLMDGIGPHCLDDLYQRELMERIDPPSFGHRSRVEYLQNWLLQNRRNETRAQVIRLAHDLAAKIQNIDIKILPFVTALMSLSAPLSNLEADTLSTGLIEAAFSLLGLPIRGDAVIKTAVYGRENAVKEVVALVAIGLNNTLVYAKEENDLARRDKLLEELRALQSHYPDDVAVREELARGLFNTLNDAKEENDLARRDKLLEELRALQSHYPDDAAVREWLAKGLYNTFVYAKEENDLARRDKLLEELRALQSHYPNDVAVRERLARGLNNTLVYAKKENDLARRDKLLEELRALQSHYPDDAAVREQLANGLNNTLVYAKKENDLARRDKLLEELESLASVYTKDYDIQGITVLARSFCAAMLADEQRQEESDTLLQEAKILFDAIPDSHPKKAFILEKLNVG